MIFFEKNEPRPIEIILVNSTLNVQIVEKDENEKSYDSQEAIFIMISYRLIITKRFFKKKI
ncbi:MAG: hypothetical protein ACRCZO_00470 [Cetobacterium sp.]